jgi:aryl-alcohol dehydrogenase-like predicted oxidoreductase
VKHLPAIAAEVGATPAQLAIAWCLANPNVSTVLLGASRKDQLEQNLSALELLPRFDLALKERIEQALA